MLRIFEKSYDTLLAEYEALWKDLDTQHLNDRAILLKILREYSNRWTVTHDKIIELIIQPYIDHQGKFLEHLKNLLSIDILLFQICEQIPEKNINSQGRLAAIFQVMKNHTGIDINTFYCKKNKKLFDLLNTENCMDKVILFLCAASDQNYSNIFNCLPKELAHEICLLIIKPTINWENNSVYHLLLELLEGYCGFNDSIPDHFEKPYANQIRNLVYAQHTSPKPLFKNAGGLLFQLHTIIPMNKISQNDGLHYIFKILHNYTPIDMTEFYYNSPLTNFFTANAKTIEQCRSYDCWLKMVLKNSDIFNNVPHDIRLLLSHPYFSALGKNGMIYSLIKHLEDYNYRSMKILSNCIDLISSTDQELSDSFLIALKNHKYDIAIQLFCNANKLNTPELEIKISHSSSTNKEFCHEILYKLLQYHITKKINSELLIKLLDHASTFNDDFSLYPDTLYIYEALLKKRDFIPDWKIIEDKFIKCFIHDMDHFFHNLINDYYFYCTNNLLAIHLLNSKVPGINILKNSLSYNYTRNKMWNDSSFTQNDPNILAVTALQAGIMSIYKDKYYVNENIFNIIKELIAYDRRCVFQRDSHGNDIFYYLDKVKLDNFSKGSKKLFNKIYRLIQDEYYLRNVATFFCGAKKYNPDSDSPISLLPNKIVDEIALLTMKPGM